MMQLHLSPVRSDAPLTVTRNGDTLVLNGTAFDFTALPEGASLPAEAIDSDWIADTVQRRDGVLHVPLIWPHGPLAAGVRVAAHALTLTEDGPVTLPDGAAEEAHP